MVDHFSWSMAAEGLGRLYEHARGKVVVYLPAGVVHDTSFPIRIGAPVRVRIEAGRLVIEPAPESPSGGPPAERERP